MFRKLAAECFGTFWLVFGGCGSAVLAAAFPELGIGFAGVALAFGLTVLTMAYAVGHISGGHFNPAVTLGLWAGGRFPAKEVIGYIIAQVVGGIIAAAVLRAGLTEVLVTGMLIKWMRVSARPIAIGAKPAGACLSVAPWITSRKPQVRTISITIADSIEKPPGECSP